MNEKQAVLKKYFGYDSFREGQEKLIDSILAGKDVLAVMPTGSGKSLCYQIPALILPGITLVISPLISLMNDQVRALNEAGIHAAYINSSLTERQIDKALDMAVMGLYKIVYVAPERLYTWHFQDFVSRVSISLLAVDEAHCVSQWGQDFRKSYLDIAGFAEMLPIRPPIAAFTATATPLVKEDILRLLKLRDPEMLATGFDRPNLFLDVRHLRNRTDAVLAYVREHADESGIVYCSTIKNVDMLHAKLEQLGIPAGRYHSEVPNEQRRKNQEDFLYDRVRVMVATNAFGMGIDKSNVRYIVHYNMPSSLENYYQEAGRAGRDGEPAECVLFYSPQDLVINRMILSHKDPDEETFLTDGSELSDQDEYRLRKMEQYASTKGCLHRFILDYFGDPKADQEERCENCINCTGVYETRDITWEAKQVINCIYETRQRYGIGVIAGILKGSRGKRLLQMGADRFTTFGKLTERKDQDIRSIIDAVLYEGYIRTTEDKYQILKLTAQVSQLKEEGAKVLMRVDPAIEKPAKETAVKGQSGQSSSEKKEKGTSGSRKSSRKESPSNRPLTPEEELIFDRLRSLRMELAQKQGVPPYVIFSDHSLREMCRRRPRSPEEFLNVSGVGNHKLEKYGDVFLALIQELDDEVPRVADQLGQPGQPDQPDQSEEAVQTEQPSVEQTPPAPPVRLKEKEKEDFHISGEAGASYPYDEICYLAELTDRLNFLRDDLHVKKLFQKNIAERLVEMGYLTEEMNGKYVNRYVTPEGAAHGLSSREMTSERGNTYNAILFSKEMQQTVVEWYIR